MAIPENIKKKKKSKLKQFFHTSNWPSIKKTDTTHSWQGNEETHSLTFWCKHIFVKNSGGHIVRGEGAVDYRVFQFLLLVIYLGFKTS